MVLTRSLIRHKPKYNKYDLSTDDIFWTTSNSKECDMKKLRLILVMLMMSSVFGAGCSKEENTSSGTDAEQTTHSEHDGHDH